MITKTTNNFFSYKTKILIDRIVDKLKCEKTKSLEIKNTKKILGKTSRTNIKMKIKNNPKDFLFL